MKGRTLPKTSNVQLSAPENGRMRLAKENLDRAVIEFEKARARLGRALYLADQHGVSSDDLETAEKAVT